MGRASTTMAVTSTVFGLAFKPLSTKSSSASRYKTFSMVLWLMADHMLALERPIQDLDPQISTMSAFHVSFTPSAIKQLQAIMARKGQPGQFFRVGVKGGGCSGFEYVLKLDEVATPFDICIELEGVPIVGDSKSAKLLQGTVVDFTGNLIGGGFVFDNPNAARSCGCGTSFTPKTPD